MRILALILILTIIFGCSVNSHKETKISYSGYYIPVEGGRIEMKLDSVSTLNKLISQLTDSNKLYETYKGYLIGYNDLMFSIAVHSNDAIKPLLKFIDTSSSYEARHAAILTIYLIGINCKVEWASYDDFSNIKAREALFMLLSKHEDLQIDIMQLLIRDPRGSDIPKLFHVMDSLKSDCWAISNGLLRYDLNNIPVHHDIPEDLLSLKIKYYTEDGFVRKDQLSDIFRKFAQKYTNLIQIEDTLYNYKFEMPVSFGVDNNQIDISFMTRVCLKVGHGSIGANYQYQFKNDKIVFYSASTVKHLWLDWWKSLDISYKESLKDSYKKIGIDRI